MTEETVFIVQEFQHGRDDFVAVGWYSNEADAQARKARSTAITAVVAQYRMSDALDDLVKGKLAQLGLRIEVIPEAVAA